MYRQVCTALTRSAAEADNGSVECMHRQDAGRVQEETGSRDFSSERDLLSPCFARCLPTGQGGGKRRQSELLRLTSADPHADRRCPALAAAAPHLPLLQLVTHQQHLPLASILSAS